MKSTLKFVIISTEKGKPNGYFMDIRIIIKVMAIGQKREREEIILVMSAKQQNEKIALNLMAEKLNG